MPDFANAAVSNESTDLSAYRTFLKRLEVGQSVTLPLEEGETTRKVMWALNQAASSNHMRIARLPSSTDAVRFRVISPEKRSVSISEEAKRARVEKSLATRAARRAEHEQLAAMGMPPEDGVEAEDRAQPSGAAAAAADASPPAASPRRRRRSSGLSHF